MKIGDRVICGRYKLLGTIVGFSPSGRVVYVTKDDGTEGMYEPYEVTVCSPAP